MSLRAISNPMPRSRQSKKIHVEKTQNIVDSDLATPEVARNQLRSSESLSASPLLEHLKGGVRYPAGSCGWGSESPLCAKA